ncbi:MAG: site-specific integrase [Lewinellaceae bacterium]|nr:site-specific integrase [Lewinellaceae bacterium]
MRAGEVYCLRISDFNREQGTLTVRTSKGGITRVLPYGGRLRDTLNQYYRQERPKDFLIPGRERSSSQGISLRGVQYITSTTLQRSRLRKKYAHTPFGIASPFITSTTEATWCAFSNCWYHAYLSTTLLYLRYASITLRDIPSPLDFCPMSTRAKQPRWEVADVIRRFGEASSAPGEGVQTPLAHPLRPGALPHRCSRRAH